AEGRCEDRRRAAERAAAVPQEYEDPLRGGRTCGAADRQIQFPVAVEVGSDQGIEFEELHPDVHNERTLEGAVAVSQENGQTFDLRKARSGSDSDGQVEDAVAVPIGGERGVAHVQRVGGRQGERHGPAEGPAPLVLKATEEDGDRVLALGDVRKVGAAVAVEIATGQSGRPDTEAVAEHGRPGASKSAVALAEPGFEDVGSGGIRKRVVNPSQIGLMIVVEVTDAELVDADVSGGAGEKCGGRVKRAVAVAEQHVDAVGDRAVERAPYEGQVELAVAVEISSDKCVDV